MTQEEKLKRLEELRVAWKHAQTSTDRKIIEKRAKLIQFSLPKTLQ